MKLDYVVNLKLSPNNYLYNKVRAAIFMDWLTDNKIKHTFINMPQDPIPHTVLLNTVDALAFKLKFNL